MIRLAHPHWALLVLKSCRPNPASRSCLRNLTSTAQKPFHLTAAHFTLEAPSHLGTDAPSSLQASDIELAADGVTEEVKGSLDSQVPEDEPHASLEQSPTGTQSSEAEKLPILNLPPRVSGWPTPHITDDDLSTYILPLYTHRWGMTVERGDPKQRDVRKPQLARRYEFKDFDAMIAFLNEVADIARTEKHHPHYMKMSQNRLSVSYHTHSAFRLASPTLTGSNGPAKSPPEPGITIRDARSAILVETLFRTSYITDGRGIDNDTIEVRDSRQLPRTVADIEDILKGAKNHSGSRPRLAGAKWRCPSCGGQHGISECLTRKNRPPPKPCHKCGGLHWSIDCKFASHVPPILPIV